MTLQTVKNIANYSNKDGPKSKLKFICSTHDDLGKERAYTDIVENIVDKYYQ